MSPTSTPAFIFGGASIGLSFTSQSAVQEVLDVLKKNGVSKIDTAGRYPLEQPGRSEELLGETKAIEQGFAIDTKILAGAGDGSGELTRESIEKSIGNSLSRLGLPSVNTLHIHRPDPRTPLAEQAAALDAIYKEGKFKVLGVSNFAPELLREFLAICTENGYIKPTVYQGEYSMVSRGIEKHLLPIMREHGMVYNAFWTLAAGFFSGKMTSGNTDGTRFGGNDRIGDAMRSRFSNEHLHDAQRKLEKATTELGITPIEAALRWATYHSALQEGDGIILGASRVEQLVSNLKSISNGPLPDSLVEVVEEIWTVLEPIRGDRL